MVIKTNCPLCNQEEGEVSHDLAPKQHYCSNNDCPIATYMDRGKQTPQIKAEIVEFDTCVISIERNEDDVWKCVNSDIWSDGKIITARNNYDDAKEWLETYKEAEMNK